MPFIYAVVPGAEQTTNATPGTENDSFFVKAGSHAQPVRARSLLPRQGRGPHRDLGHRVPHQEVDVDRELGGHGDHAGAARRRHAGAKGTAAYSASALTSGTGGPTLLLTAGCGAAGPGGWVAPDADSVMTLEAAATQSIDAFVSSGTASMKYEMSAEIGE
jgi:hypothetical protein